MEEGGTITCWMRGLPEEGCAIVGNMSRCWRLMHVQRGGGAGAFDMAGKPLCYQRFTQHALCIARMCEDLEHAEVLRSCYWSYLEQG